MSRRLVAFVVVASILPLITFFSDGGVLSTSTLVVAGFTVSATLAGMAVVGRMRRRGWLQWTHCALAGAVVGSACALPFAATDVLLFVFLIPAFATIGATHGLLFWLIALWGRAAPASPASDR